MIEVADSGGWRHAGAVSFSVVNRRSRVARVSGFALVVEIRGRGVGDLAAHLLQRHLIFDLGLHRVELECYRFNARAIRSAERAGYVREGVRRRAYWRHGEWVDGVLLA